MATYTVQKGDTKKSLQQKYGISISDSQYRSQNPNELFAGEIINIPEKKNTLKQVASFVSPLIFGVGNLIPSGKQTTTITEQGIDLSNVTPMTPVREEPTVVSYQESQNGTRTGIMSDGTTQTTTINQPTIEPFVTQETQKEDTAPLLTEANRLQQEISDLEKSIADRSSARSSAYEEAGIFDDVKRLNELKDTLRTELTERQKLRGTGATQTEFKQATAPELEKAYIESAALSNIVNANMAAIDQKLNDKYESDKFLLDSRTKRLDTIMKSYSDIMTEEQKVALENAKQKNAIELENIKLQNDITKGIVEEARKAGVNPSIISNAVNTGDYSAIYEATGRKQTLKGVDSTTSKLDKVDSMLDNVKGLAASVGPMRGKFNPLDQGFLAFGDAATFREDAKNLVSEETMGYFLEVKNNGATFGAMSKDEWDMLAKANDTNALGIDRETGKSKLPEKVFRERLLKYKSLSQKAIVADYWWRIGLDPTKLREMSDIQIDGEFQKIKNATSDQSYENELTGTSGNFIQQEEGFKSTAYPDQAGVWTIGYGTTKINGQPVKPGDTITKEEALRIAKEQIVNDYSTFADLLGDTELTPSQFTALNSFEYNLGSGVWNQPSGQKILNAIKNKDYKTAGNLMQQFVNVRNPQTGQLQPNSGLISRRQREAQLLLS